MSEKYSRKEIVTWEARVQRAYTTEAVVGLARDFIATWGPAELQALPEHLRPGRIRSGDDVAVYAFKLMSRPPTGTNGHILTRMVTFFSAASHRLAQIQSIAAEEARARANEDAESP